MTLGICPAPGCNTAVPLDRFLCRPHWYSLPAPLRRDVWRTWRARLAHRTADTIRAHEEAKRQALAALVSR